MYIFLKDIGNTVARLVRDGMWLRLGGIGWAVNPDEAVPLRQLESAIDNITIVPRLDVFVVTTSPSASAPYKTNTSSDYDATFPLGTAKVYVAQVTVNRGNNLDLLKVEITGNSSVWGSSSLGTIDLSAGEGMANHYQLATTQAFTSTVITYTLKNASNEILDVKTITLTGTGGGSGSGSSGSGGSGSGGGGGTYSVSAGSSVMSFSSSGAVQSPPDTFAITLASLTGLVINGNSGLSIQGGNWMVTHISGNSYSMVLTGGSATLSGVIPITSASLTVVSLSSAYPANIASGGSFAVSGNVTV